MPRSVVFFLSVSLIVACQDAQQKPTVGNDQSKSEAQVEDAGVECIFPAPPNSYTTREAIEHACPVGCTTIGGYQLTPGETCGHDVLLGCARCENGCGGGPEGICFTNETDGRIITTWDTTLFPEHGWRRCTKDEYHQLFTIPSCFQSADETSGGGG